MTDTVIETAERLLRYRRCALNDIKNYESQLKEMSLEYKIDVDLTNDKVYKA